MSVRENDDGTVTKYYTDGSEEQGKLNQPISGDGFRPISLPTAQKIMEKSPEGAKKLLDLHTGLGMLLIQ